MSEIQHTEFSQLTFLKNMLLYILFFSYQKFLTRGGIVYPRFFNTNQQRESHLYVFAFRHFPVSTKYSATDCSPPEISFASIPQRFYLSTNDPVHFILVGVALS